MDRLSLMYALEGLEQSGLDLVAVFIITCLMYFTGLAVWYMLTQARGEPRRVRFEAAGVVKGVRDGARRT